MTIAQTPSSPTSTVSERKRAANQRNAQKSTGPKTAEGKATVSLNAYKHGLCSDKLVLPTENVEQFESLRQSWFDDFKPQTEARAEIVDRLVANCWKMRRCVSSQTQAVKDGMNKRRAELNDQFAECLRSSEERLNSQNCEPAARELAVYLEGVAIIIRHLWHLQGLLATPRKWRSSNSHNQLICSMCDPEEGDWQPFDKLDDAESINGCSERLLFWNKAITVSDFPPIASQAEAERVAERLIWIIDQHVERWQSKQATMDGFEVTREHLVRQNVHEHNPQVALLQRYEAQLDRSFRANFRDLTQLIKTDLDLPRDDSDEVEQAKEIAPAPVAPAPQVEVKPAADLFATEAPPAPNKPTEPAQNEAVATRLRIGLVENSPRSGEVLTVEDLRSVLKNPKPTNSPQKE